MSPGQNDERAHVIAPVDDLAGAPILESERRMSAVELTLVLSSVSLAAVAQLLLRHGMQAAGQAEGSLITKAATSPHVIGGLLLFGISALLWLYALSRVPLSKAYPFNAISYVGILVAARFIGHEHVTKTRWLGALFVVVGLLLVVRESSTPVGEPTTGAHSGQGVELIS